MANLISFVLAVVIPPVPPSGPPERTDVLPGHPGMMKGPTTPSYGIACHSCYNVQQYLLSLGKYMFSFSQGLQGINKNK